MMKKGFTVLELIIAIAVAITIAVVIALNFSDVQGGNDLKMTSQQISGLLREAQSNAMTQQKGAAWGVYFSNVVGAVPFYALFYNSYTLTSTVGSYPLPSSVFFATSTLALGATTSITFATISGLASASKTIMLYVPNSLPVMSSTITIASSGAIAY
jgi:Tfp pilus assembly protein FimT